MIDPAAHLAAIGRPPLMLVTTPMAGLAPLTARAVRGGVDIVQWRVKDAPRDPSAMPPADRAALVRLASAIWLASGDAILVVNGPQWLADASNADGRHLPEDDADRPAAGLIGRSVHSARAASTGASGAHYLVVGTIYASASHPEQAPAGPELLTAVRAAVDKPILAIGGITPERVADCLAAGASGIAVLSGILQASDPAAAATTYRRALDAAKGT